MVKILLALVIGFIGVIVGVNLADTPPASPEFPVSQIPATISPALTDQINGLQRQVNQLIEQARQTAQQQEQLQKTVAALNEKLAGLEKASVAIEAHDKGNAGVADSTNQQETTAVASPARFRKAPQTTSEVLAAIGVDPVVAQTIEQRSEKREMDQLYLRNKAIREGWFGTEKYFQENRKLEQESNVIREELGDDKYDEYLYASGRFNRIKVASVLAQSPAEQAGIQAGDLILSYDNKRIFTWSDLTTETAAGSAGETVEVSVLRDNTISKVYLPRGPMGIRLESTRVDPSSNL